MTVALDMDSPEVESLSTVMFCHTSAVLSSGTSFVTFLPFTPQYVTSVNERASEVSSFQIAFSRLSLAKNTPET